jgi:hypothetical protein
LKDVKAVLNILGLSVHQCGYASTREFLNWVTAFESSGGSGNPSKRVYPKIHEDLVWPGSMVS